MSYSGVHFLNLTKTYKNKLVSHVFETLNCKCIISFMKYLVYKYILSELKLSSLFLLTGKSKTTRI